MRLGVDLGGTKIEIVGLAADGRELLRRRIATPQGDYRATLTAIAGLVAEAEAELGQTGSVGIGIPGAESLRSGLIKNANSTCLIGQPLRHDLQTLLRREVRLANDANCFALSEAIDGAGRDVETVFGVILGTGVGGGIVIRRQVLVGANAIAGEWGHNPLPRLAAADQPAPDCYCGHRGCIETYLSGPGLTADHARHTAETLDATSIECRAAAGDAACEATGRRHQHPRPTGHRARRRPVQHAAAVPPPACVLCTLRFFRCGRYALPAAGAWRFVGCARRRLVVGLNSARAMR